MQKDSKQSSAVIHEERLKTSGVKAKSKQLWLHLVILKISYRLSALQILNKTASKMVMDLFYNNLKKSLGIYKSTSRTKINKFFKIKDPCQVI